jgi:pimeloyl-ACP methyl ester carboxylesterase
VDYFLSHDWAGILIALLVGLVGWGVVVLGRRIPRELRKRHLLVRSAGFLVLGLAVLMELGAIYHVVAVARRSASYPAPGIMVDVGGYRMHLLAEGENRGNPTIIWFPGAHDQGYMMHHLHTAIAAETRSIIYDRASTGWSDIGPYPRTVELECGELRALLEGAGEEGPFLVAGHSFGGLLAANFAHHYPELIAGVLLMDSTPPWNVTFAASFLEDLNSSLIRPVTFALLFGLEWRYPDPILEEWTANSYYEGEIEGAIRANDLKVRYWRSFGSALMTPVKNPFSMVIGAGALGDVPLFLLTEDLDNEEFRNQIAEIGLDFTDIELENFLDGLDHGSAQLTSMSTRGEMHFIPDDAGHQFPYEDPDFTLAKTRELMGRIRADETASAEEDSSLVATATEDGAP